GQFRAWLLRIAENIAIDAARSRMRQKRAEPPRAPAETLQQVAGNGRTPADIASDREGHDKMLALLRSLPKNYRKPLMLRYFGGADYESMEVQLGLTNGALRGTLHRGLKMLRDKLLGN